MKEKALEQLEIGPWLLVADWMFFADYAVPFEIPDGKLTGLDIVIPGWN